MATAYALKSLRAYGEVFPANQTKTRPAGTDWARFADSAAFVAGSFAPSNVASTELAATVRVARCV